MLTSSIFTIMNIINKIPSKKDINDVSCMAASHLFPDYCRSSIYEIEIWPSYLILRIDTNDSEDDNEHKYNFI